MIKKQKLGKTVCQIDCMQIKKMPNGISLGIYVGKRLFHVFESPKYDANLKNAKLMAQRIVAAKPTYHSLRNRFLEWLKNK